MQGLASQVGEATGFHDVLQGDGDPPEDAASLTRKLVDAIGERLAGWTNAPNQSLQLSITEGGLRVDGDHPRAAEIEALASGEPQIAKLASQLYQSTGEIELTIDLTNKSEQGNILGQIGG